MLVPGCERERIFADLAAQEFDVVILGGGITGAGVALDAALRGLKVALFEKVDFASGTSSKSTKLVHGGLRYLAQGQFAVTLESVRERQLLQKIAPHLVWSLPFTIPLYRKHWFKNLKLRVGLWVYDLMAGVIGNRFHKRISAQEVERRCPGIRRQGLIGGLIYYDCRTDDARHTLELIRSAAQNGATAVNYAGASGYLMEEGKIAGVLVRDTRYGANGQPVAVRARVVVNATGVWTQQTAELSGGASSVEVVPAKGIHITLRRSKLPLDGAMLIPSVHDDRFCFAVPWYDSIVIGTTDTEYRGDLDDVKVEPKEKAYILDALNAQFPGLQLTEAELSGSYAGLRPLLRLAGGKRSSTAGLSRRHALWQAENGLITISGGKLTTYRPMAKETVDLCVGCLVAKQPGRTIAKSSTDQFMLGGWHEGGEHDVRQEMAKLEREAVNLGLEADTGRYLPTVYGRRTREVLELVRQQADLAARISAEHPYVLAQVIYAIRCEGALTIEDVLARRIRLTITDEKAALAAAEAVGELLAQEFGWSTAEHARQLKEFKQMFKS